MTTYRQIDGFPGYRVGDDGTVWCCRSINGKGAFRQWRLKCPNKTTRFGHCRVDLYSGKDERRFRYVHRLVLEAFVGPCPDGMEACHNDGNPLNNCLSNLRWDTHKNNQADRWRHGTARATLTEGFVAAARRRYKAGETIACLARESGVCLSTIRRAVQRQTWTHVA